MDFSIFGKTKTLKKVSFLTIEKQNTPLCFTKLIIEFDLHGDFMSRLCPRFYV